MSKKVLSHSKKGLMTNIINAHSSDAAILLDAMKIFDNDSVEDIIKKCIMKDIVVLRNLDKINDKHNQPCKQFLTSLNNKKVVATFTNIQSIREDIKNIFTHVNH